MMAMPARILSGVRQIGLAVQRGQALTGMAVLSAVLLSACGSGLVADAAEVVPGVAGQSVGVERLGLMRVEAAGVVSHADWDAWFTRPWQPRGDLSAAFDAVRFTCSQGSCTVGERLQVSSCNLLFEADSRGLDVEGMEAPQAGYLYRRLVCYAGRALDAMQAATVSHVSDYVLDSGTLADLPAELGYPDSPGQLEEALRIDEGGGRMGDFLENVAGIADLSAVRTSGHGLRLEDGTLWTREWLLLGRGDFDGDGVEDLLVGVNLYITDEALRFGSRLHVLTRKEAGVRLQSTYQIPILGDDTCNEGARCASFRLPERR